MPNMIPRSNLWDTPTSTQDLLERVNELNGTERALVMSYVMMTFNLAAKMRDEDVEELIDQTQLEYGMSDQAAEDLRELFEVA